MSTVDNELALNVPKAVMKVDKLRTSNSSARQPTAFTVPAVVRETI